MLTLRLFGGLSLTDSEGVVPARATQRRRLALLAILVVRGEQPTSRDRLIGLLWPDADRERARHLLSDSLYVLRESLHGDLFRLAGDSVALDPARVTSDVMEFKHALAAGDLLTAVELYGARGAFLDGVHLVDSVEFERWVDAERDQLATDYRWALDKLAGEASRRGDLGAAVTWRRRLAAEAPLSSSAALSLMHALAEAGDPPGAVAFARVHTALVRAELDCPPDGRVVALAEELRTRAIAIASARDSAPAPADAPSIAASEQAESGPSVHAPAATARRRSPARRRAALTAGTMSLAVAVYGALAWRGLVLRPSVASAAPTIAIVPFAPSGGGQEVRTLANGVTESVVHALSASRGPRVVTATFRSEAPTPAALRQLGDRLHVAQAILVDVQRHGARIHVGVRLVDAASDYTRWSGSYQGEPKEVLALEDDVGRAVAVALSIPRPADAGASRAREGTTSLAAYDLYLRGRHQIELRSDTGFRAAVGSYRAAIEVDSGFAAAYAGLAEAYSLTGYQDDYDHFPPRETTRLAEAAALKALALDDSLGEAHLALGIVRMIGPIDFAQSERELKRALALDPTDPRTRSYLSKLYDWSERPDAALAEARRLVDADPLSTAALRELARALLVSRRYDEALAQLDRARTLGPPMRAAPQMAGEIYIVRGMYPQAIAALRTRNEAITRAYLGYAFARSGDTASAQRIRDDFVARWRAGRGAAFDVAVLWAGLREYDRAFEWLDRSIEDNSIRGHIMEPLFDELRADPRFAHVRRHLLGHQ